MSQDRSRTVAIVLMVCGGLAWLAGELIGVHRQGPGADTTSEFVWWLEKQRWVGPTIRALVLAFTLSLAAHFALGWSLIP